MKMNINIKPITNNSLYIYSRGRRIKSPAYYQFQKDFDKIVKYGDFDQNDKSEVYTMYVFHISNYGNSDTANHEKAVTDMLVAKRYLNDDRYIRVSFMAKEKVKKGQEMIEVFITKDKQEMLDYITEYLQR